VHGITTVAAIVLFVHFGLARVIGALTFVHISVASIHAIATIVPIAAVDTIAAIATAVIHAIAAIPPIAAVAAVAWWSARQRATREQYQQDCHKQRDEKQTSHDPTSYQEPLTKSGCANKSAGRMPVTAVMRIGY